MKKKLFFILSVLLVVKPTVSSSYHDVRPYDSIFSFGDSFADTGNGIVLNAAKKVPNPYAHRPYGMTFFGRPTGRATDGRLIIDFVASELRLPFVRPSLASPPRDRSFDEGANFATSGGTALDVSFFRDIPIASQVATNTTSSDQLQWFQALKPQLCGRSPAQACPPGFFGRSLFFVGEFGFCDYSFALLGTTLPQVRSIVPDVVGAIANITEELIKQGAMTLVVPGIPPMGCFPANLETPPNAGAAAYDYEPGTGCLRDLNQLCVQHNTLLKQTLVDIQRSHPSATVLYADFYTRAIDMVENPGRYGFIADVLRCCCGGGGRYNYNMSAGCGTPGATVCDRPADYMFWDGHFTDAAYRHIAKDWVHQLMRIKHGRSTNRYFDNIARATA